MFLDGLKLIAPPHQQPRPEEDRAVTPDAMEMLNHLKQQFVEDKFPNYRVWNFTPHPDSMQVFSELRAFEYVEPMGGRGGPWRLTAKGHQWILEQLGDAEQRPQVVISPSVFNPEPEELAPSLKKFREDHPDPSRCVFLMMRFAGTPPHENIVKAVKGGLAKLGMKGLRADDRNYAPMLWLNIETYLRGCGAAIAIFDRIETDDYNPNVSLECGYMMALRKPLCLLKDKTLRSLHTDLTGHTYRPFDPHRAEESILNCLKAWFKDEGWEIPQESASDGEIAGAK